MTGFRGSRAIHFWKTVLCRRCWLRSANFSQRCEKTCWIVVIRLPRFSVFILPHERGSLRKEGKMENRGFWGEHWAELLVMVVVIAGALVYIYAR